MSIAKIFVKVFGEDIFEKLVENEQRELPDEPTGSQPDVSTKNIATLPLTEQIAIVKRWLNLKLESIDSDCIEAARQQHMHARTRLGPENSILELDLASTVRISSDKLSIRSQGSFNTIKANVCVYGGSWMYETHLYSKGVMQIGWCTNRCSFNENSGVGDSKMSYGFDGSKRQKWHICTSPYGERWEVGDIIGVCINVDRSHVEFFRNGRSMGIAFTSLEQGPGVAFFPAVSLGFNQSLRVNFGGTPFKYPVNGYRPLQIMPIAKIQKSDMLLNYLVRLTAIISRSINSKEKKPKETKLSTKKTLYIVFCSLLIENLSQYVFDNYVVEKVFLKYFCDLSSVRDKEADINTDMTELSLDTLLSLLWNYMEADEIKYLIRKIANSLLTTYAHTHKNLDYSSQCESASVMTSLCKHSETRKYLLESKFFKKHFLALFTYLRPPEYNFMQEMLPHEKVWTEGIGGSKLTYLGICQKIASSTETLYNLHKNLMIVLLSNDDDDAESPSSRKMFMNKYRRYVMDMSLEQRPFYSFLFMQSNVQYHIENNVALSFFCLIVDVLKTLFEKEIHKVEIALNPKYFFDGTFDYQHFDRLGGVLSHLRKVHRNDIAQQLGTERTQDLIEEERSLVPDSDVEPVIFITATNINSNNPTAVRTQGTSTFAQFFNTRYPAVAHQPTPGRCLLEDSLYEIFDTTVILYYSVSHKYIVKICSVRDEISYLNNAMSETKVLRDKLEQTDTALDASRTEDYPHVANEIRDKLKERDEVLKKRSIELARKQAWYRAVAMGRSRCLLIIWFLDRIFATLDASSKMDALFAFVPEVYINVLPILLDTVMDFSYHDLLIQFDMIDAECVVNNAAEFLGKHLADSRIILASCKDSLLQALGMLTCHKSGILALQRITRKSQSTLIEALLRPYENRAWGQSNWLLLRFWLGDGFAFRDSRLPSIWQGGNECIELGLCRSRAKSETHTGLLHHVAPPSPSKHYQKLIGDRLVNDEPYATTFLNSVLGQLNWAFSEFILLLQEIQNVAQRQENSSFEPKQLKICSMCFELTVSLMRCLEMIISIAPQIFQDAARPNSDLILNRVCQLISQVLSRVTVPPGCFQFIIDLCSADLNLVAHFPIITAALGILLALMRPELESDKNPAKVSRITRALLTDPSFQFANLEFALGEIKTPILQQTDIPRGNFDPQTRAHIDPLTNDIRVPMPSTSTKRIRSNSPILRFALSDYPTHVTQEEITDVERLIDALRVSQSLLSVITLPSEDSLCPICCAKPITVVFSPCKHQSCSNCILQHLMNSKVCFYCKTMIKTITRSQDGTVIYHDNDYFQPPAVVDNV